MALALAERPGRMSPEEFLAFYEDRPEEERWELYDGVPAQMMTPVFPIHNLIASRLDRLLNDALERHDPSRVAVQRPGLALPEAGEYRPEPDLIVTDAELPLGKRYLDRAYLLAEMISSTDRERVRGLRGSRIALKRDIYRRHAPCEVILLVEQDRVEVVVDLRTSEGWASRRLADPEDMLHLPTFGLSCRIGDLYAKTPLRPRGAEEAGR